MEKDHCITCGQEMYQPLLDEYKTERKKRKWKTIAIIKSALKEEYKEPEKEATLFAHGLAERLQEENII
ncbi:MAG: hypothetical protein AB1393_13800 [Candidatus Edwardsbacteria bacterium]